MFQSFYSCLLILVFSPLLFPVHIALSFQLFRASFFSIYAHVALVLMRILGIEVDGLGEQRSGRVLNVISVACEHTLCQNLSCFLLCSQLIKEHGQIPISQCLAWALPSLRCEHLSCTVCISSDHFNYNIKPEQKELKSALFINSLGAL